MLRTCRWGSPSITILPVNNGGLYVPELLNSVVKQFSPEGVHLGDIGVSFPSAVAVDPSNGNVYVASYFGGIHVYDTGGNTRYRNSLRLSEASDLPSTPPARSTSPTAVGFAATQKESRRNTVRQAPTSAPSTQPLLRGRSRSHRRSCLRRRGERIVEFDSSGTRSTPTGAGLLSGSIGLAVDSGERRSRTQRRPTSPSTARRSCRRTRAPITRSSSTASATPGLA